MLRPVNLICYLDNKYLMFFCPCKLKQVRTDHNWLFEVAMLSDFMTHSLNMVILVGEFS
uniref:Uncharacterized protein n=1 Tax=Rhizophora mucronata TaxID=61149 RepID=A0A2P2NIF6_RHIMU